MQVKFVKETLCGHNQHNSFVIFTALYKVVVNAPYLHLWEFKAGKKCVWVANRPMHDCISVEKCPPHCSDLAFFPDPLPFGFKEHLALLFWNSRECADTLLHILWNYIGTTWTKGLQCIQIYTRLLFTLIFHLNYRCFLVSPDPARTAQVKHS